MLLLLAAGLAQAEEDGRFDKLDFDRDGKVSRAEAAGNADLINGFDRSDRNRDGKLTRAEYDRLLDRAAKAAEAKAKAAEARARAAEAKSAGAGRTSPKKKKK
jgi:hypothetical protein